ncbi:MAG: WD40 repeat domain-containing protein, partial [Myxococcota bacterium]|nr:WD40 repeat domain-containing protein [Myxococcota bacterium]
GDPTGHHSRLRGPRLKGEAQVIEAQFVDTDSGEVLNWQLEPRIDQPGAWLLPAEALGHITLSSHPGPNQPANLTLAARQRLTPEEPSPGENPWTGTGQTLVRWGNGTHRPDLRKVLTIEPEVHGQHRYGWECDAVGQWLEPGEDRPHSLGPRTLINDLRAGRAACPEQSIELETALCRGSRDLAQQLLDGVSPFASMDFAEDLQALMEECPRSSTLALAGAIKRTFARAAEKGDAEYLDAIYTTYQSGLGDGWAQEARRTRDRVFARAFEDALAVGDDAWGRSVLVRNANSLNEVWAEYARGRLWLWDAVHQNPLRRLETGLMVTRVLEFSLDGTSVLSGGTLGALGRWGTHQASRPFVGQDLGDTITNDLALAPFGDLFATAHAYDDDRRHIRIWDLDNLEPIDVLRAHSDSVQTIAFNTSGSVMATGSSDYSVRLWDMDSGTQSHILRHVKEVTTLSFSPDDRWLVSGGQRGHLRIWSTKTGVLEHEISEPHQTDDDGTGNARVFISHLSFSPDGSVMATAGAGPYVKLWDVQSWTLLATMKTSSASVSRVMFHPTQPVILTIGQANEVSLWNQNTYEQLPFPFDGDQPVLAQTMAFSPNGQLIALADSAGLVEFRSFPRGRLIATAAHLENNNWIVLTTDGRFDGSPGGVQALYGSQGRGAMDLETFMVHFHSPGLLAQVLGGHLSPPAITGPGAKLGTQKLGSAAGRCLIRQLFAYGCEQPLEHFNLMLFTRRSNLCDDDSSLTWNHEIIGTSFTLRDYQDSLLTTYPEYQTLANNPEFVLCVTEEY